MCAKILQRHFSKLTFICDYPMHYYHIEQLGSKVGEGMWRDPRQVLRPHLSLAVFGLDSCHQTASPYGQPRSFVRVSCHPAVQT